MTKMGNTVSFKNSIDNLRDSRQGSVVMQNNKSLAGNSICKNEH